MNQMTEPCNSRLEILNSSRVVAGHNMSFQKILTVCSPLPNCKQEYDNCLATSLAQGSDWNRVQKPSFAGCLAKSLAQGSGCTHHQKSNFADWLATSLAQGSGCTHHQTSNFADWLATSLAQGSGWNHCQKPSLVGCLASSLVQGCRWILHKISNSSDFLAKRPVQNCRSHGLQRDSEDCLAKSHDPISDECRNRMSNFADWPAGSRGPDPCQTSCQSSSVADLVGMSLVQGSGENCHPTSSFSDRLEMSLAPGTC